VRCGKEERVREEDDDGAPLSGTEVAAIKPKDDGVSYGLSTRVVLRLFVILGRREEASEC
jgi:hypothetical protein